MLWVSVRFSKQLILKCFVIFRKQISALGQCTALFIDGTFKTAPKPYKQIVTINGKYLDHVIPVATALLSGKTVGHYRRILQVKFTRFD